MCVHVYVILRFGRVLITFSRVVIDIPPFPLLRPTPTLRKGDTHHNYEFLYTPLGPFYN